MKKMRSLVIIAFATALVSTSCGYLSDQGAAQVGSRKITVSQMKSALDSFEKTSQFKQLAGQSGVTVAGRRFELSYLSNQIREAVIRLLAPQHGIVTSAQEVSARIDQIKQSYSNASAFQDALDQQGISDSQLQKLIADQILQEKLKTQITQNVHASKAQIRRYYDSHRSQFHQVHLAHISFSSTQFDTAVAVEKQINSAPASKVQSLFAKAAARYSADTTTASKGGDIGTVTYSQLAPNIKYALARTKVGNASQPVNTQQGFELFLLLSSKKQNLSQSEQQIRTQIETAQQDSEWMKWLQQRYSELGVSVNPRFGRLSPSSLQVVDLGPQEFPNGAKPPPSPTSTASPLAPLGG